MAKKYSLNSPKVISKIAELVDDMMDDYSYTEEEYSENPIYKDWDEVGGEGYAPNTQSIVEESGSDEDCCGEGCEGCAMCSPGNVKVVKMVKLSPEVGEELVEDLQEELEDGQEIVRDYMMSH